MVAVFSIIGSFLSFLAILLSSAKTFGKRSHLALAQVEAEIDAAVGEIERQVDVAREQVDDAINRAKQMETRARKDGNGNFVLNGSKNWITNSPIADVFVRNDALGHRIYLRTSAECANVLKGVSTA